jgi:hypothetical protein
MGRSYAGALGLLAFALVAVRGVLAGGGAEETLLAASAAMFAFAAVGYIVGNIAEHLVNESVRTQFQAAMAAWDENQPDNETPEKNPAKTPAGAAARAQ